MIFIESPIFTEDLQTLLTDEEYAEFQSFLVVSPEHGDVIQGTGGLRKIRWAANGKGKRGGVRVIYYHVNSNMQIRLIYIYKKGVKDDLSEREKAILRQLNERW